MNNECLKGVMYINRLLDLYSNNNDINSMSAKITEEEFSAGIDYMIENDMLNSYELSFLGNYSKVCKDVLQKSCTDITDERVLCFDNRESILNEISLIRRLSSNSNTFYRKTSDLFRDKTVVKNRVDVEYDNSILQIIPYMMIIYNDDLVLLEKKKGDSRLLNKIDLPAGHCSEPTVLDSMISELKEELNIKYDDISSMRIIDFIPPTNNTFSISYYHLGVMVLINLKDGVEIENSEDDKHNLIYLKDLIKDKDKIKSIGDWASYGILQYLDYKDNLIKS